MEPTTGAADDSELARLRAGLAERYAVEGVIGRGGMATVYRAQDLKHGRRVAIKVLRSELAGMVGPERFLREIAIAAQLHHPHILQLYDSGQIPGSATLLYYVMPLVEGDSLRGRLTRAGELPIAEAVRILREITDASCTPTPPGSCIATSSRRTCC